MPRDNHIREQSDYLTKYAWLTIPLLCINDIQGHIRLRFETSMHDGFDGMRDTINHVVLN